MNQTSLVKVTNSAYRVSQPANNLSDGFLHALDNSSICLHTFFPNVSAVMTRVHDCVIEIDDPFYYTRLRMCAHVCMRSQRAEGTHCDPGCVWPPEAMLAAAEMMIKELGVGLENVD